MDFLNNLERKYIPSIHKFRYDTRKARVNELKQVCKNNPEQLSYDDVRVILRVLKHYKLLPITKEYEDMEKKFMFKAGEYFLYASVLGFSPFLLREFFRLGTVKRTLTITGLFVCAYGLMMRKPLIQLNTYNKKVAQQNIHKFNIDLQEVQDEISTKQVGIVDNAQTKKKQ